MIKILKDNYFHILSIIGICIILTVYELNNIYDPNLWYDEVLQFWYSNGISSVSKPFTQPSFNPLDVIHINATHNMDPGGYTMLLFLHGLWNDSVEWLRFFPYLFFAFSVVAMIAITKELSGSLRLGFISGFMMFLLPVSNLLFDYAFELRAYSMEACGILTCFYLLLRTCKNTSTTNLLTFGLVSVFFIGSRYSFWIFSFVASLALFIYGYKASVKAFITKAYLYYLPIFISILFFIFNALLTQTLIQKFTYHYTDFAILGYQSLAGKVGLFIINFFSLKALPISLFILTAVLMLFNRKKLVNVLNISKFSLLLFTVTFYELMFIVASLLKSHPWLIHVRWSIGLSSICLICAAGLLSIIYLLIKNKFPDIYPKTSNNAFLELFIIILLFYSGFSVLKDRKIPVKDQLIATITDLESNDKNFYNNKYFIPTRLWPAVKYQFEYGKLSDDKYRKIYPDNFVIAYPPEGARFDSQTDLSIIPENELKNINVVLLGRLPGNYKKQLFNSIKEKTGFKFKEINSNIAIKQKLKEN